ncbi:MAG: 50S ribosomal protein L17 [Planctomycetaceae bacterium]|nr:50S ribosomal protein L17 [Planctomycetaceae bacterium]MCA9066892.1 50S ribosomal protein L17 [Planctomycetaceae bacterium]
MRHLVRGRKLGRNGSHRKAMFRNMACSLINSVAPDEDAPNAPKVKGRIVTTVPKAKELRPFVEKLVTLAKKAAVVTRAAESLRSDAERGSDAWNEWRKSDQGREWVAQTAPALALRRRAFAMLRDEVAVDILFDELADRFAERDGGYTRIVRLAKVRLGDAGQQALIEFVGERDRTKSRRRAAPAVEKAVAAAPAVEPVAETPVAEAPAAEESAE